MNPKLRFKHGAALTTVKEAIIMVLYSEDMAVENRIAELQCKNPDAFSSARARFDELTREGFDMTRTDFLKILRAAIHQGRSDV